MSTLAVPGGVRRAPSSLAGAAWTQVRAVREDPRRVVQVALGLLWLLDGTAQPLTGAPGGVLLYGAVGLVAWPTDRRGGLIGVRGARLMWASLWLLMAWLWVAPVNRSPDSTRAVLLSASSGIGWLTRLQTTVAVAAEGHGLAIAIVMCALCAAIALGVLTGRGARLALDVSIILSLVMWLLGQGLGGVFAGGATDPNAGPLFVLLAAAMYPLFAPARGAPRRPLGLHVPRPVGLLLATVTAAGALSGAAMAATSGYTGVIHASGGARALKQPVIYRSHHGVLNVTLTASEQKVDIGGKTVLAKVYNNSFVAPTLMIRPGDRVRIKLVNHLDEPTNLHFHGLEISPSGHADNIFVTVNPGRSFQYHFRLPSDHATGTFWYHSHVMVPAGEMAEYPLTSSEEQVFDGLSGLIEVEGLSHDLPRPMRNIPQRYLALRDVQTVDGQIVSTDIDSNAPTTRLIDGQIDPRITIASGQTELWHIANIGADIFYRLKLPGHTFDVIAQDGHPVIHATRVTTLVMPPGKRWDVLVQGTQPGITHLETLPFNEGDDHYPQRVDATLMTTARPRHPQPLPRTVLPHQINLLTRHAVRHRTIIFSETENGQSFFINGQSYQENKVQFHAKLGTVEQWTIVNHTDELHVFHMHTYPQQLLSVNGVPQAFNGDQDETPVPIHGYIVMRIWFRRFTGETVFHCHILSHEDMGMMANIRVTR